MPFKIHQNLPDHTGNNFVSSVDGLLNDLGLFNEVTGPTGPSGLSSDTGATGPTGYGSNFDSGYNYIVGREFTTGYNNVIIASINDEFTGPEYNSNVFIGPGSGVNSIDNVTNNIGIGRRTFNTLVNGDNNIGMGNNSFANLQSGVFNVSIISNFDSMTQGNNNIGIGNSNFRLIQDSSNNIGIGTSNFVQLNTGVYNIGIGAFAGFNAITANDNFFLGHNSGLNCASGSGNIFIGTDSGKKFVNSVNNITIGTNSGSSSNSAGQENIIIGSGNFISANVDNCTVIGNGITNSVNNGVFLNTNIAVQASGNSVNYDTTTGQIGPSSSSRRYKCNEREVELDTSGLTRLQIKEFEYNSLTSNPGKTDIGLIAEEVKEIYPILTPLDSQGNPVSVRYNMLTLYLIQQNRELKKQIDELYSIVENMKN